MGLDVEEHFNQSRSCQLISLPARLQLWADFHLGGFEQGALIEDGHDGGGIVDGHDVGVGDVDGEDDRRRGLECWAWRVWGWLISNGRLGPWARMRSELSLPQPTSLW
jgi:hypothetical protein